MIYYIKNFLMELKNESLSLNVNSNRPLYDYLLEFYMEFEETTLQEQPWLFVTLGIVTYTVWVIGFHNTLMVYEMSYFMFLIWLCL